MDNHICGVRYWTFRARGKRFGEHVSLTHVLQLGDRGDLGETYLQHVEALDVVRARVATKYRRVGHDGVLTHYAVRRHLRLNGKSWSRKRTRREKVGRVYDGWFLVLASRCGSLG